MDFFVDVYLPLSLPKAFTYRVKEDEYEFLKPGFRVAVPFGKTKIYTGVVARKHNLSPQTYDSKSINSILDDNASIKPEQIKFWEWISNYYQCSIGSVLRASIPASLLLESETTFIVNKEVEVDKEKLSDEEYLIYEALEKSPLKLKDIEKISEKKNTIKLIQPLVEIKAVILEQRLKNKYKPKTERVFRINNRFINPDDFKVNIDNLKNSPKQLEFVLTLLSLAPKGGKWIKSKTIFNKSKSDNSIAKALIKKSIIEEDKVIVDRIKYSENSKKNLQKLSVAQDNAYNLIKEKLRKINVVLLQGVTSSGKTAIYMTYIKDIIDKGNQVLFLLPEISITSQMVTRFQVFFGNSVKVYHSKFSLNERTEVWKNVYSGFKNARVIIGARSSLFLPFNKLKLIIVDEEHELSYKQFDPAPRYHARDAAIYLAKINNAKVILGSATPSLESVFNVLKKKYEVVNLKERYGGIKLPEIDIIDLKLAIKKNQIKGNFTTKLIDSISDTLNKGKQVILFQNRRGYAPVLECITCGHVPQCVQCDVSLTHHMNSKKLQCHYCGYNIPIPIVCHSCGSSNIKTIGSGTQQIEEQLKTYFPQTQIARMDWDSTRGKYDFDKIINSFSSNQIKILIGTQMIIKGLDFENVHLVGVINADSLINFPDFRSYERSFQMLTQVSGRAGRSKSQGKVLIQTYQPNHPVIKYLIKNDVDSFNKFELNDRKIHFYPPYNRLLRITLKNRNIETLNIASDWFLNVLSQSFKGPILGPVFPPISRVRNYYHKQILIKLDSINSRLFFKKLLRRTKQSFDSIAKFKSTKLSIDVDPY
ncbi:MAG: primosomal protein N' [Flavobacteriaceae bacterium]|nr:primosomal protein N' [Flavobacteriaceae bacterium]